MRTKHFFVTGMVLLVLLALVPAASAQDGSGRICVAAYNDNNMNGLRDAMEPLLPDVVVTLISEQNVALDNYITDGRSEPSCFNNLGAGSYTVTFVGGLIEPTGSDTFALTLVDGQTLPAQVQFGAVPQDASASVSEQPVASQQSFGLDENSMLRLMLALGGAGVAMIVLAMVGVIVYWVRYRRAQ